MSQASSIPQALPGANDQKFDASASAVESYPDARIACPSCDLIFNVANLADGATARCSRCGQFLTRRRDDALDRVTAYSIAALVMLAVGCAFPFMKFSRAGLENTMTLPQTVLELWDNNMPWLAVIVAAFILLIPGIVSIGMLVLSTTLSRRQHADWLPKLGSLIFHVQNWSMVEVFFVGVLVSLVKIAKMATIVLGASFWAYAAFTILFTLAITNLDKFQCWQTIERLRSQ
jgi:paraquat-inducible protein A